MSWLSTTRLGQKDGKYVELAPGRSSTLRNAPLGLNIPGWPHSIPIARKLLTNLYCAYQSFLEVTLECQNTSYYNRSELHQPGACPSGNTYSTFGILAEERSGDVSTSIKFLNFDGPQFGQRIAHHGASPCPPHRGAEEKVTTGLSFRSAGFTKIEALHSYNSNQQDQLPDSPKNRTGNTPGFHGTD
jgi:hypothetical protein